jgi:hypothetical protein
MPRSILRLFLHWTVIITMVATSLLAPVQALDDAMRGAAAAQAASAMAEMPCGDEMDADSTQEMPCDCCTPASCDLSACLGTACLMELHRVAAAIPLHMVHERWNAPARPARLVDTPLRPPIA